MRLLQRIQRSDWILISIYYSLAFTLTFFAEWSEEDVPLFSLQILPLLKYQVLSFSLQLLAMLIIVFGIFPTFFPQRKYLQLLFLTLFVLAFQEVFRHIFFPSVVGPLGPNYLENILWGIIDNFGDITPIALFLMAKQYYTSQNQILSLERNQKEAELRQLEAQVDPHFLFNNLNILDILIASDPGKARVFTQKLSSLYRYLIRHRNEEMVPLTEEWAFSQNYIYLLQQRFANLFVFETPPAAAELAGYFIPPAVMQTLLENVVKHNTALPNAPIKVVISLQEDYLHISNSLRPKQGIKDSLGTGIENLNRRLEILTGKSAIVEKTSTDFSIKIPLVKQTSA